MTGGRHALETGAGHDVTFLMETSHPLTDIPWQKLEQFRIGTVQEEFVHYTEKQPMFDEIKQKVRTYFKTTGLDPKGSTFTLQVFIGIAALYLYGLYGFYHGSLWGSALFGVSRALVGIHTMHAFSHFSVTHSPFIWKWGNWFCFDIMMGSTHWAWDYQHVVGHHQHTNVFKADPDLPISSEGTLHLIIMCLLSL